MGRKRNLAVREYFNYINYRNESVCKLCNSVFRGSYSSNLTRHMKSKHNETYEDEYKKAIEDSKEEKKCKKVTFSIEFEPSKVKDACVELVTAANLPFSFLDCRAFKFLTEQIFSGLGMCQIDSSNIMELVTEKYKLMKDDIKKLIKQKLLSLKIDTATRLGHGILGIHIQFVKNNTICVKTLEMIELHTRHTADALKSEIEQVLENFDISKNQIYTITTDNGRNMLKPEELLNASINGDFAITEEETDEFYENLTANLTYENIMSIRCAGHTLQLIMKDFISLNHKDLIDKSRQVAKTLRTPKYRHILTNLGSSQLELDVPTCWNSTFKMLQQLLKIRKHLDGNFSNVFEKFSVEEWTEVENLVKVLEPIYEATVKLQKQQLFLGDYYKLWMGLKLKLESLSLRSTNAKEILQIFERHENTLVENNALISAIYLDPRLRFFLNSAKKQAAKIHLKKLATQMVSIRKNANNEENIQSTNSLLSSISQNESSPAPAISDDSTNQSTSSLLRQSLLNIIDISDEDSEEEDEENKELQAAYCEIESFLAKRLDVDADIMQFWEENRYSYPTLYKLAKIVHCVPASQMSVERCFSALKLILSDLRYNLTDENLRKFLFVRANISDAN